MEASRDDFIIAIRSAFLKRENQQRFSLIGLMFFSLVIIILGSFNFKIVNYLKIGLKEVAYRASFIVSGPENFLKKNYSIVQNHFSLYSENKENKFQLELLRSKNLDTKIITLENIKYKKLIDDYFIKDNETYAKVLIDKQSPFLRSVIINKGSKNNIKLGMIILDDGYLIGKVVEVNFFTSRVLLISDINSKIPVSLQPGDIQAIMSGKENKLGVVQYVKDVDLKRDLSEFLVITSGAGGVFKSGIPVGMIKLSLEEPDEDSQISSNEDVIVEFYKDFSQLKYVKVVSYSKANESLDASYKEVSKKLDSEIARENEQNESLRILLEQKKISEEIRIKIEEENNILKNKINEFKNELEIAKNNLKQDKIDKEEIKFLKMNSLYGKKCRKNFFNNLYKEGTQDYKNCILNKGPDKKNE